MPFRAPGMSDISPQRHGVLKTGREREDADHVSILQLPLQPLSIQRKFLDPARVVVVNSFHHRFLSIRSRGEAPRHLDRAAKTRPLPQFVNRRHIHAASDGNGWPGRRNIDHIPGQ